jgi:Tol biopolymer transport system component
MRRTVTGFLVTAALWAGALKGQQEVELQAAIRTEMVDGDLKAAIQQYGAIVAKYKQDRAVAAKALIRMAECYQKLGDGESRKIYERVLREYADQREAAATARARLGSAGGSLASRLVLSTSGMGIDLGQGSIAADGRTASGTDYSNGDLILRDMSTGQIRPLLAGTLQSRTLGGQAWAGRFVAWSVLSPDQRQVAFARYGDAENPEQGQLWVMSTESGATPRLVTRNPEFRNVVPQAWSLDGKSVLAHIERSNQGGRQIAWISMADGSVKSLKSFPWDQWIDYRLRLSPDGKYIAYSAAPAVKSREMRPFLLASDGSTENPLTATAGVSEMPVWTPDGAHILFISDGTGSFDLWSVPVRDGKAAGSPSLVKRNIGRIENVGMTRAGSYYYLARNSVENVAIADLKPTTRIKESFVGIRPTLSPDGRQVAFTRHRPTDENSFDLVIRSIESGEEKVYSGEAIRPVPPGWFHDGKSVLTLIAPKTGSSRALHRIDVMTGESKQLLEFDPRVLAAGFAAVSLDDKTLYIPGRDSPGGAALNRILSVDPATGQRKHIFTLKEGATITEPLQLSPDGRTVACQFADKTNSYTGTLATDGSGYRELYKDYKAALFGLAWTQDGRALLFGRRGEQKYTWEIMSIPAAGGSPVSTGLRGNGTLQNLNLSATGSRVAFSAASNGREIWALDNVLSVLK